MATVFGNLFHGPRVEEPSLLMSMEPTTANYVHTTINNMRNNVGRVRMTTKDKNRQMLHEQIDMARIGLLRLLEKIRNFKLPTVDLAGLEE